TGWLQGGKYGFIFDATPNDFISGELEHAVYECWEKEKPEVIILEGQSSLRNPSGPCGSELIISCELDAVVLQHAPGRKYYKGLAEYGKEIPGVSNELELLKMYGVETIAIGLNTMGLTMEQALEAKEEISKETGLPVILPLDEGMSKIVEIIKQRLK
ncbi:MAG: NAD-dependent epimerase/dehydratase family protein, partial [Fulvivirga sp.]